MADLRVLAVELATKALDLAAAIDPAAAVKATALEGYAVEVPEGVDAACAVFKASDAKRYTLGVAYPALQPDVAKAMDGFRDVATPEIIEAAAWGYLADHRDVGLVHFTPDTSAGQVVESYIYRGPDWVTKGADGSEQVIREGDWLLGTVWTPPAWDAIKSGRVNGLSFVGSAARRRPSADTLARLRR